jgi:DNA replication protein DnaC
MYENLHRLIDCLRLKGMAACLDQVLSEATRNGTALQDTLATLLEAECQDKAQRALDNRLRSARMPWDWSIDTFPFKQQPDIAKSQIMSLAKLDFVKKFENITLIGNPGVGKTGIAIGLLRLALISGYRGRFYNAQDLLNDLYASLADKATSSLLKTIVLYDLIVIDELGYLTLTTEQINIFFKLIDMRYTHKKATIITTNLDYLQWYEVFQNKALVDAMLDRFKHYCTTIYIKGASLRAPVRESGTKPAKQQAKPDETKVIQGTGEIS